jgi:Tfp pilus assembly protein PilF
MRVLFQSAKWDIAVLTVDDTAQGRENWVQPATAQPVIVRLSKSAELSCQTVGFPQSETQGRDTADPSDVVRQTEQAVGTVEPAGQGKPPVGPRELPLVWMPLDVDTATPGTQAGWGGMSGAGVVLPDGRLIGLVVDAEAEHQQRRLYLVPLAEVLDRDAEFGVVAGSAGAPLLVEVRHAAQFRETLMKSTLGTDGLPRRIDQIHDLGVFGVERADLPGEPTYLDYVDRDDDHLLERRLADAVERQRVLLVVGVAASGKSRSAAQAAGRVLGQYRLLCPKFYTLPALARLPLGDLLPAVVWLDDVQDYAHGTLRDDLEELLTAGVAVVATVRRKALENLTAPGEVRDPDGKALCDKQLVDRVDWPLAWSVSDRARVSGKVRHPGLQRAISKGMPLGVYCVAGPELLRRIEEAISNEEMFWGYPLIRTVLDWYRTGIATGAPLTAVMKLMPLVAAQLKGHPIEENLLKEDVDEALNYFTHAVIGEGRQTRQSVITVLDADNGPATITVHDFVLDRDHEVEGHSLLDEVWITTLNAAPDTSAQFRIGITAYNQNRRDISLNVMQALADDGVTLAMCNVGALLLDHDPNNARHWLERALASEDPQVVPLAQANLGVVLMRAGELGRARELLEAALESEDPQVVPLAQTNLARLLMTAEETRPARELLEAALESEDPQVVPLAQTNLARLLMMAGEPEGARELLEAALASGNPQAMPQANDLLGDLLASQKDWQGAQNAYQAAIDSADPYWTPFAQIDLGLLRQRQGDVTEARELLEAALESGNPQAVPIAQANLGAVLMRAGETGRGRELLEAALESGNPQAVPIAQANLGVVLMRAGETGRGRELLEMAIASRDPQVVPLAQKRLGEQLISGGDIAKGLELLKMAIASRDPQVVEPVMGNLGAALYGAGAGAAGGGARVGQPTGSTTGAGESERTADARRGDEAGAAAAEDGARVDPAGDVEE